MQTLTRCVSAKWTQAGWGALGGVIAQYRTVLTAAAMTPWMDRVVVQPYIKPALDKMKNRDA